MNENKPKKKTLPDSLDQGKQTADLLPTLCPTALSPKPWANITNYSLVQTLLINGARRPGLRELTKQTWHGVLLYISVPSVSLWGWEHLVVWVGSMAHCGLLSSAERRNVKRSPWLVSDKWLHGEKSHWGFISVWLWSQEHQAFAICFCTLNHWFNIKCLIESLFHISYIHKPKVHKFNQAAVAKIDPTLKGGAEQRKELR